MDLTLPTDNAVAQRMARETEAAAVAVEASMRAAGVTAQAVLDQLRPPAWQTLGPRLALERGGESVPHLLEFKGS